MTLIAAERIKLVSTPSPWWCAGGAIAVSLGLGALLAATNNQDGRVATVASTQLGYASGMAVVMVMATLAVTTEYSVGTIRTTFMAVPRRGPALIAKAVVVALLAAAIGLIGAFGAWAISQLVLPDAQLSLAGFDDVRHVAGVGLVYLVAAVIAVAIGIFVRHTAGAVAITLAWALMVEQLFELIPGVESIRPWLPFRSAKEFLTADAGADTGIFGGGPWMAFGYFVVVAVVLLGAAVAVAQRRDA